MIHALRSGLLGCSFSALNRTVLSPLFRTKEAAQEHWRDVLDAAGVTLERRVRERADTRGIFIVRHPVHGRCVLKTLFSARHGERALANLMIAQQVAKDAPRIFPRVFEATEDYTIEEYIDGAPFRQWLMDRPDWTVVEQFFIDLKAWSQSTTFGAATPHLHAYETREICYSYIKKCFWLSRYCSALTNLGSVSRLTRLGSGMRQRLAQLAAMSESVQLPRTMMCGDMGNINLIAQPETRRIYNIDYEYMNLGHWGFDCAYLLSSLYKMRPPRLVMEPLEEMVLSESYLGGADAAEFFRLYTGVLRDVSLLWFRPAPEKPGVVDAAQARAQSDARRHSLELEV